MNTYLQRKFPQWGRLALCLVVAGSLVACGGDEPTPEPTATTAPTATAVPATATPVVADDSETQAESPLAQPESPISQPESPLTVAKTAPRTEAEAIALAEETLATDPSTGMGTIAGVVYSFGTVPGAVRGTQVYLEEASEIDGKFYPPSVSLGPKVADGDIIVETNDLGQVYMEAPPGNYYAAVWTLYDWRLVMTESGVDEPQLITIEAGDQLDLGVLYVYWP